MFETTNGAQPTLPQMPPAPAPPSLRVLVEGLLFVAGEPVTVGQLARALEAPPDAVEAALEELAELCRERGVRVQRHGEQVQLVSAPEAARAVGRFLGVQAGGRLSSAALEVLAIIAYRQPLTRAQVDMIRGVDSSGSIRALLARDLVQEAGRLETVGRPILYATTPAFLQQFGLTSLADLPPMELPEVERPGAAAAAAQEGLAGEGV
jgi:segregation and condensation protein B